MAAETRDTQNQGSSPITIWSEWSEQDLLGEKWDAQGILSQSSKSTKDPKGKSASFEDPDGRVRLPHSLLIAVREWKRPQELFGDNLCVIRNINYMNLKGSNHGIVRSEFMRHFISYVTFIWFSAQRRKMQKGGNPQVQNQVPQVVMPSPAVNDAPVKSAVAGHKESKINVTAKDTASSKISQPDFASVRPVCFETDPMTDWAPWNLIFGGPLTATKMAPKADSATPSQNLPQYNPNGKYAVRLFWMGTWRKIIVDDYTPVDDNNISLLPTCSEPNELWPIILCKAVLKVVALDYGGGLSSSEMGDPAFILHVLTGWVPYVIYLDHPKVTKKFIWNKLQALLALNRKAPPEDILSALAVNWDIRTIPAARDWKCENHPANLQKIEILRNERANSVNMPPTVNTTGPSAPLSSQSAANSLAPKSTARGASAVPRKPDSLSPSSLTVQQNVMRNTETPKITKQRKIPEIFLMATYRSAHHEQPLFDKNAESRSESLYSNGFLRSESHPIFLRRLRDVFPQRLKTAVIPRFKTIRPLKIAAHRYTKFASTERIARSHAVRFIGFLSLFWRPSGRMIFQSRLRAEKLTKRNNGCEDSLLIKFKPTNGYRLTLPAIMENVSYPRIRKSETLKEPSPPPPPRLPTPAHDEKPTKAKGGEGGKGAAAAPPPELPPPAPAIRPPAGSAEELQRFTRMTSGSIEFNQFINSLEHLYIICKPESFDHTASFSYYQPNVVVDGRVAATKKKGGAEPAVQHSVNNVETTRMTPKQAVNNAQIKFGKTLSELPSVFLFVDNPYSTNVIFSVSTVSRWPYTPRNNDVKSQDRLSIVHTEETKVAVSEKPFPVIVTAKLHNWMDYSVQPTYFSLKTSSVQGVCYHIPAGKYIWRLSVTCPGRKETEPQGFVIKAVSKDPLQIGAEEQILKLAGMDSYYFSLMARKVIAPLLKWWRTNGSPTFTHPPHQELIRLLGLEEDAHNKACRGVFFQAMLRGLYGAIQLYLKDFCHPKGSMALRAFFADITTTSILKFTSAQLTKRDSKGVAPAPLPKSDAHGGRPTETMKRGKQKNPDLSAKESKANPAVQSSLQVDKDIPKSAKSVKPALADLTAKIKNTPEAQKAVVMWEMYFFSLRSRAVREARRPGKKKESVLKICQEMLEAIVKIEQNFATCFLRGVCRHLPASWLDTNFILHQESRCVYKDISGLFTEIPPNTWRLLFRDTFAVNEPVMIAFRLSISLNPCRLFVIDNDTGESVSSVFFQPLPFLCYPNETGYTLVSEVKSGLSAWRGGAWTLRTILGLDPLKHESTQSDLLMPKFANAIPQTVFITKEISDYFLPEINSTILARLLIRTKTASNCTIQFTTSDQDVLMELLIMRKQTELYRTYGRGICVIPSWYFKEDSQSEPYYLQANVLENSWILTGDDSKFCYTELLRRSTVEYGRETPVPVVTISPAKSAKEVPSKKGKGKEKERAEEKLELKDTLDSARSTRTKDTKEKDKPVVFEANHPYWTVKFVLDVNDNDFEYKKDNEKDDTLKAELTTAMAADPTVLQRGKEFREEYLKKAVQHGFIPPDSPEYVNVNASGWPRPLGKCPVGFDWEIFARRDSGDSAMEMNPFVHERRLAELRERQESWLDARSDWIISERKNRDEQISAQTQMLRNILDTVSARRLQYTQQREEFAKLLDEQEGRTGLVAPPEPPPKTTDKKKKK